MVVEGRCLCKLSELIRNGTLCQQCCNQPTIANGIQNLWLKWFGTCAECIPFTTHMNYSWEWTHWWKIQHRVPRGTCIRQIENDLSHYGLDLNQTMDKRHIKHLWYWSMHISAGAYWMQNDIEPVVCSGDRHCQVEWKYSLAPMTFCLLAVSVFSTGFQDVWTVCPLPCMKAQKEQ